MCYSMTRTLANSTETTMMLVSLQLWISVDSPNGPLSFLAMRVNRTPNTLQLDQRRDIDRVRDWYLPFPQWTYILPAVSCWCRPTSLFFWALPMLSDITTKLLAAKNDEICKPFSGFMKLITYLRIICSAGASFSSVLYDINACR